MTRTVLFAAFAFAFMAGAAHASSTAVNCTGVNDDAAVQNAFNAGGEVVLQGNDCKLTQAIGLATSNTSVELRTTIVSTASPAIVVSGQNIAIESIGKQRAIWGPGTLLQLGSTNSAIRIRLTNLQFNGGTCIIAHKGAGLIATDLHCNGKPPGTAYAVVFRQWDTARFTSFLTEEMKNGFKFEAGAWNIQMSNVVLDRLGPNGAAVHLSPGSGALGNIQISNLWASQGKWPLLAEVTTGTVSSVQVLPAKYSNFEDSVPTIQGAGLTNYQHPYDVFTN